MFSVCGAFCCAGCPRGRTFRPEEIIQKFAAKEAEFRKARENYTYRQSVKMEELDGERQPSRASGKIVSDIIFGPNKQREEKVMYAPDEHAS